MIEVADVLRRYGTEYLQKFGERMLSSHRRAFKDILRCRTPAMGGHVFECNHCGRQQSCPENSTEQQEPSQEPSPSYQETPTTPQQNEWQQE